MACKSFSKMKMKTRFLWNPSPSIIKKSSQTIPVTFISRVIFAIVLVKEYLRHSSGDVIVHCLNLGNIFVCSSFHAQWMKGNEEKFWLILIVLSFVNLSLTLEHISRLMADLFPQAKMWYHFHILSFSYHRFLITSIGLSPSCAMRSNVNTFVLVTPYTTSGTGCVKTKNDLI